MKYLCLEASIENYGVRLLKDKFQKNYLTKNGRVFVVRRARPKDLEILIRNFQKVAHEGIYVATEKVSKVQKNRILASMKNPRTPTMVADFGKDGGIAGSLNLSSQREVKKMRHVLYLGMVVNKEFRENGVGSALMEHALEWAKTQKEIEKISLSVFSTNKRAIKLYKKFGFRVEGVLKKEFILKGKYADEVVMGLFLG
jgi:RimJ/RimL family protein N-acetyltransferase